MDERYHFIHESRQQGGAPVQNYVPQPHLTHDQRRSAPRAQYRATKYDGPMYDHQRGAHIDSFVGEMQQDPYSDRQSRPLQGPARLSLVPAPSRLCTEEANENEQPIPRSKLLHQQTFDYIDQRAYAGKSDHLLLNSFAYTSDQPLESSSDVPSAASSSPALNAGRRRVDQLRSAVPREPFREHSFQDSPPVACISSEANIANVDADAPLPMAPRQDVGRAFQHVVNARPKIAPRSQLNATPIVQGIPLVPVSALPDRLRTIFPFPMFNAVQSKCFDQVFGSDSNFVLSSPTGSGKTAILELAICRAVANNSTGQYKVVYQAPTKALCSERQRDWDKKFTQMGLRCAELTGDSDSKDLRSVQSANIIITTPEKWDSMTRKWKDHQKLLRIIKLFLIDEVHILNDDRGAVLEAVVSRMKSISSDVRFVALSATVPNFNDVATWLGKSPVDPDVPAPNESFGEEFRPVKLKKHVCGYVYNSSNDWAFERQLDAKLPEIISKYSERKPMMIFCATRKSCATTATTIAKWWDTRTAKNRPWNPPSQNIYFQDRELRDISVSGVAFHHAGIAQEDRFRVEQSFLKGDISVICCTSTLAVGVNLPCHLVIIKNTMCFSQGGGLQEYSDLDMMQMLGRAGRPQFDDSAVAVIMTRQTKVQRYEALITGQDILESKLHLNLIEHMNAEIGLGTIRDLVSARKWLTGTFLYVRLQQNPVYYKLEGSRSGQDVQEQVDDICFRDIALLKEHNLAVGDERLQCTEFGHVMARYYVRFDTMKIFMGLQSRSTLSEILSAIAQAAEFSRIRFRQGEKSTFKALNKSPSIRFPIPVNLDLPAHKVSLLIQATLGHTDLCWDGEANRHKQQYLQEIATIFKSVDSLLRCIIDCQIFLGDSVGIHSALSLERALGSKAWDDSPLQMIQIPELGAVAARKLANAGIRSIEDLEAADARRIETIIGRNPPFGVKVLEHVKSFPKLRISLHIQQSTITKTSEGVKVQVKADIGFINEKPPDRFVDKPIYVCLLAETSDGRKSHFARISGFKLGVGQSLVFPVLLTSAKQSVNCYLMCEGMAGTMREATVSPKVAPSLFPPQCADAVHPAPSHKPNISRRRIESDSIRRKKSAASDEFGDADIDDDALANALNVKPDFEDIDNFAGPTDVFTGKQNADKNTHLDRLRKKGHPVVAGGSEDFIPAQLPNGRWACFHKCKNKETCKHFCCKNGLDRPPKKAISKCVVTKGQQVRSTHKTVAQQDNKTQTKLQLTVSKRKALTDIEQLDLTQQDKKSKKEKAINGPHNYRDLHQLHKSVQNKDLPSSLHSIMDLTPAYCYGEGGDHQLSFLGRTATAPPKVSSEYGDLEYDDIDEEIPTAQCRQNISQAFTSLHFASTAPSNSRDSETFEGNDLISGNVTVGVAESQDLQAESATSSMQRREPQSASAETCNYTDVDFPMTFNFSSAETVDFVPPIHNLMPGLQNRQRPYQVLQTPFVEATSSPEQSCHFQPAVSQFHSPVGQLSRLRRVVSKQPLSRSNGCGQEGNVLSDSLSLYETLLTVGNGDVSSDRSPHPTKNPAQSDEMNKHESQIIPDGFKDLQPWLFQEFGDIVELVED